MTIQPVKNFILLEPKDLTETESGIVLADTANVDRPNIATVVKTGPDAIMVNAGDKVMFQYHLFDEVTIDKKQYLLGREDGVVAHVIEFEPEPEEAE